MLRSEMHKKTSILSLNYSKRCKLFVFPKDYLKDAWLGQLSFTIVKEPGQRSDLLFCLIMKLSVPDDMDHIPPQEISGSHGAVLVHITKALIDSDLQRSALPRPVDKIKKLQVKKGRKGMDFEDVKISLGLANNKPKNKLQELLGGRPLKPMGINGGGLVEDFEHDHMAEEPLDKLEGDHDYDIDTPVADRRLLGNIDSAGRDMDSIHVRKQLGESFNKPYDKDLNSDQKLFAEKYNEFEMALQPGDLMNMEPIYENEAELRFSEEGNHSPAAVNNRLRRRQQNYDEYADGFGTMLHRGTHDYDPMSYIHESRHPIRRGPESFGYEPGYGGQNQPARVPYNPEHMSRVAPQIVNPQYSQPQKRLVTEDHDQMADYNDILEMNDGQETLDLDENR